MIRYIFKSHIVFLKKRDDGVFYPVNWLSSTIPSSLSQKEVASLLKACDDVKSVLEKLPEIISNEQNGDCALLQARVIASSGEDLAKKSWTHLVHSSAKTNPLKLAHALVGLNTVGAKSLVLRPDLNANLCEDVRDGNVNLFAEHARGEIVAWSQKSIEASEVPDMISFARLQNDRWLADLVNAYARKSGRTAVPLLVEILESSSNVHVQYACFRSLKYAVDSGMNVPTFDLFSKNNGNVLPPIPDGEERSFPAEALRRRGNIGSEY